MVLNTLLINRQLTDEIIYSSHIFNRMKTLIIVTSCLLLVCCILHRDIFIIIYIYIYIYIYMASIYMQLFQVQMEASSGKFDSCIQYLK